MREQNSFELDAKRRFRGMLGLGSILIRMNCEVKLIATINQLDRK